MFCGKVRITDFGLASVADAFAREESRGGTPAYMAPELILRCLEKDPTKRPARALQVAAALPGGDPLAAALAAGETPSPEMVAASGKSEGLRPVAAWALLAGVAMAITAAILLGAQTTLYRRVPQFT